MSNLFDVQLFHIHMIIGTTADVNIITSHHYILCAITIMKMFIMSGFFILKTQCVFTLPAHLTVFIDVYLIHYVLITAVQQSNSGMHGFLFMLFPYVLSQRHRYNSCYHGRTMLLIHSIYNLSTNPNSSLSLFHHQSVIFMSILYLCFIGWLCIF